MFREKKNRKFFSVELRKAAFFCGKVKKHIFWFSVSQFEDTEL